MGFIKESRSNNRAGLIVAFRGQVNTKNYVNTDSIEEAINYFKLIKRDNDLLEYTESEKAISTLEIVPSEAPLFREQVNNLIANLNDDEALKNIVLYPIWQENIAYKVGDRIRYNKILFKVLQDHTSQFGWEPSAAASLFAKILIENPNVITEWQQPDSTNPYMLGDKVLHNGSTWTSTIDNNVWEPGTEGAPWEEDLPEIIVTDFMAGNSYKKGDRVMFEGTLYESLIDNNVWSPVDYPAGWVEVTD